MDRGVADYRMAATLRNIERVNIAGLEQPDVMGGSGHRYFRGLGGQVLELAKRLQHRGVRESIGLLGGKDGYAFNA